MSGWSAARTEAPPSTGLTHPTANIRLGLNVAVPTAIFDNCTVLWDVDNSSGTFRFVFNETSVPLEMTNTLVTASVAMQGTTYTLTAAAPTVAAGQIGYGGTTAAASNSNCNVASPAPTECVVINVAGTTHFLPYY